MMIDYGNKNDDDDDGNGYEDGNDDHDDVDDDHVAVGAPWVHPVSVHELDRRLAHRLHWTIHLVNMMIMMMTIMMAMITMMMVVMMVMMMMISTSCTAWSNCFLVITTFLGGIFSGSITMSFWGR